MQPVPVAVPDHSRSIPNNAPWVGTYHAVTDTLCSKNKKLMKSMKFPSELDLPVNLKKVNWTVMKDWIAKRITELLGIEEEVLIGMVFNELTEKSDVSLHMLQLAHDFRHTCLLHASAHALPQDTGD